MNHNIVYPEPTKTLTYLDKTFTWSTPILYEWHNYIFYIHIIKCIFSSYFVLQFFFGDTSYDVCRFMLQLPRRLCHSLVRPPSCDVTLTRWEDRLDPVQSCTLRTFPMGDFRLFRATAVLTAKSGTKQLRLFWFVKQNRKSLP